MKFIDENNVLTLLGEQILPGKSATINFNLAKLYTTSSVEIPIIIERAKKPGPVILITSGIHGDEINGVEIVRQIIARKINKPKKGTIICGSRTQLRTTSNDTVALPYSVKVVELYSIKDFILYRFPTTATGTALKNDGSVRIKTTKDNEELSLITNGGFTATFACHFV